MKTKSALDPCYYGEKIDEKTRVAEILAAKDLKSKDELFKLKNENHHLEIAKHEDIGALIHGGGLIKQREYREPDEQAKQINMVNEKTGRVVTQNKVVDHAALKRYIEDAKQEEEEFRAELRLITRSRRLDQAELQLALTAANKAYQEKSRAELEREQKGIKVIKDEIEDEVYFKYKDHKTYDSLKDDKKII